MKIYIDDNQVLEIPETNTTIKFEMEDGNYTEMDVKTLVWLMTEPELPTP